MDSRWQLNRHSGQGKALVDYESTLPPSAESLPIDQSTNALYNQPLGRPTVSSTPDLTICTCYRRFHYQDGVGPFFGLLALTLLILILAALLAGITLAIMSTDLTWLEVMLSTGPEKRRKMARAVAAVRRRGTWFLCSMLLCTVFAFEALPVLLLVLFGGGWLPLIIGTLTVFLIAELLPQFLLPLRPLTYGYFLSPLIWSLMYLTSPFAYPLSWILDRCTVPKRERGMYSNEQLSWLLRMHERGEKHGGAVGPDAGRVMRGALEMDGRTMEREYVRKSLEDGLDAKPDAVWDVEKSGHGARFEPEGKFEVIVPWSKVKNVGIDEEVDTKFVNKLKGWAYSRIPVVGDNSGVKKPKSLHGDADEWQGQRVFGFLHIKNLLGLDLTSLTRKRLLVKDLPLYPLPIVRDDLPLYDLLNMFQLGMSRMAIVIPAPPRESKDWMSPSKGKKQSAAHLAHGGNGGGGQLWNRESGLAARLSEEERVAEKVDWTTDFISAAQFGVNHSGDVNGEQTGSGNGLAILVGIGCPQPLGIVTCEDILDQLMQKTSCDEGDFFIRRTNRPSTKRRKEGDSGSVRSSSKVYRAKEKEYGFGERDDVIRKQKKGLVGEMGTMRRRNISGHGNGSDRANQRRAGGGGAFGMDGHYDDHDLHPALRAGQTAGVSRDSSYTDNSVGGFHGPESSADTNLSTKAHRSISVNNRLRRFQGRSNFKNGKPNTPTGIFGSDSTAMPRTSTESASEYSAPGLGHRKGLGIVYSISVPKNPTSREIFSSLDEVPMASEMHSEDTTDAEHFLMHDGDEEFEGLPHSVTVQSLRDFGFESTSDLHHLAVDDILSKKQMNEAKIAAEKVWSYIPNTPAVPPMNPSRAEKTKPLKLGQPKLGRKVSTSVFNASAGLGGVKVFEDPDGDLGLPGVVGDRTVTERTLSDDSVKHEGSDKENVHHGPLRVRASSASPSTPGGDDGGPFGGGALGPRAVAMVGKDKLSGLTTLPRSVVRNRAISGNGKVLRNATSMGLGNLGGREVRVREQSFHDDRGLLPSQRRYSSKGGESWGMGLRGDEGGLGCGLGGVETEQKVIVSEMKNGKDGKVGLVESPEVPARSSSFWF